MEMLDALGRTFDHAGKIVGGVRPDQLDAPTPCSEWNVRSLLQHMTGVVANMGRGASGGELLADMNGYPLDSDFGAQFRTESARTLDAWKARGLDGEVNVGAGPMPAQLGLSINLVDTATHTWDLACATGQDAQLPDDLAAAALAAGQGFLNDDVRKFAGIDPAVPVADNATATEKLAAFMGRTS